MREEGLSVCLFIGTLTAGGAERVMSWLANQLAQMGHEVTLVTMGNCGDDFFPIDPAIRRIGLGMQKRNHILLKPFANMQRIFALRSIIRERRVSRMVAFMPHENVLAVLATRGTGCRVVISERSAPWKRDPGRVWAVLRQGVYRLAECHVAQTTAVAGWLERTKRAKNVRVVPNPVSLPIPSTPPVVNPAEMLRSSRKCVIAMGSRPHLKGFDLLARAFARLVEKHPDWDLAIPGLPADFTEKSAASADLQATLARQDMRGRVHLPGRVGNPGDWFHAADAFVLSSRTEGFPNVLIEAMAHGCPVAAFDCETGPRDIVDNGRNGLLVADGDVDALVDALDRIMGDRELRDRLGTAARDVVDRFSEEHVLALWQGALA